MKILIISHEYPPIGGGGANACMNLSMEYIKLGHEVTIVTSWYPELEKEEKKIGLRIIRVPSKRKHKEYCSFGEMLDYLSKAIRVADQLERTVRYDICQVFFAIPSGPIGYYLKRRYKLPYIIRFGGGDIPGFQERFRFVYKIIAPFEKIIWKHADELVANSEGLKRLAERFYSKKDIKIIPNGVNYEVYCYNQEIEEAKSKECYKILFVSRLIERKGLQYIIPQLNKIELACNKPIKLIVVGDGPYRKELETLAMENGVLHIVQFVGQKDKKELPRYYQDADLFILPSKKEGMPNVVLEAMASGLPIVMTPCEGSDELIDNNGYAVPVEKFFEKIIIILKDEKIRRRLGERSLDMIQKRFQWSGVAKEYEKIMRECHER